MASKATISIGFKLEDAEGGFRKLILDADALRQVMNANVTEADKLGKDFVNFAAVATSLESVSSTLDSLQSAVKEYTGAYAVQNEVETQLAQVMRNTMDAREEDIQSIKDFCSAQQQIGIIGDEVQLAGAQELATYLELKSSLKALIPVMNDMLAQQYGLAASGENASQIATMLGKVMEGQTGALSRYGYKFDEAQEKVLKFGTESERVAVLVDVVSDSVGGMNEKLAQTPSGRMKQLENDLGDVNEQIGGLLQAYEPFLSIGSSAVIACMGVVKLTGGVRTAAKAVKGFIIPVKLLNAVINATGVSARVATVAIKGLMISTGVGVAFMALSYLLDKFSTSAYKASDAADTLSAAESRAKRAAEMAAEAAEVEDDARKAAVSSIELNISRLKDFKGSKEEEKKIVKELNDTYGDTMGYFSSVASWYQALVKNSQAYCRQLVAEAKARKLADQIAELELSRDKIARLEVNGAKVVREEGDEKNAASPVPAKPEAPKTLPGAFDAPKTLPTTSAAPNTLPGAFDASKTLPATSATPKTLPGAFDAPKILPGVFDKAQKVYDDYTAQILAKKKELEDVQKEMSEIVMPVKGSKNRPDLGGHKSEETRLQKINKLIAEYQEKYVGASETERAAIREKVAALEKEKGAIELAKAELERPADFSSLEDYDKEITYWTKLRKTASAEELASIDENITRTQKERDEFESKGRVEMTCIEDYEREESRLQSMRKTASAEHLAQIDAAIKKRREEREAFERSARVSVDIDKIGSYRELEEEIAYCTELLKEGTESEKKFAAQRLPRLRDREVEMSTSIASAGVAASPEEAGTISKIDQAISLLDTKIQNASADEVMALQKTKQAFEEKKKAYERGIESPQMQKEVSDMLSLSDRDLKIKVRGMGFDTLSEKINEIREQLEDLDNPPTEGQRQALEELKGTYEDWRRECVMSFDTLTEGWNNIKGIASGVESITGALADDANAWERITGVVDGFIQIYNGISAVITILQMLGIVTKANAAAKTEEAAATTVTATAQGVQTGMAEGAAVAQAPVIAANKLAAQSYMELAAAQYFAAHASIPLTGFGIASGFVAGATSIVQAIGVMPFADGGVIYGPTLGLMGEYAGAKSNPEVVAPLNKLKEIIGGSAAAPVVIGGEVRLRGRDIIIALENEIKVSGKSGKKFNL